VEITIVRLFSLFLTHGYFYDFGQKMSRVKSPEIDEKIDNVIGVARNFGAYWGIAIVFGTA
jgi:hypothetical protein